MGCNAVPVFNDEGALERDSCLYPQVSQVSTSGLSCLLEDLASVFSGHSAYSAHTLTIARSLSISSER